MINSFGGIRYQLELEPNGNNFLVYGHNGSGKSTIVNAIDFLLSGKISRMSGEGTDGINFKKHGPHMDASPEESNVTALIELQGISDPIEIKRSFENPDELIIDEAYIDEIKPIVKLASRSQHILTKKEILKFVTSTTKNRGLKIIELLKLEEIEDQRKILNDVNNSLKRKFETASSNVKRCMTTLGTVANIDEPSSEDILSFVNSQRSVLGGEPLSELDSSLLKEGISPPAGMVKGETNVKLLEQHMQKMMDIISQDYLKVKNDELTPLISKICSNPKFTLIATQLQLTRTGLELLDESGQCPLCNVTWEPIELKDHLEKKLEFYKEVNDDLKAIEKISEEMVSLVTSLKSLLKEVINSVDEWELEEDYPEFKEWDEKLTSFDSILKNITNNPAHYLDLNQIDNSFAPKSIKDQVSKLLSFAKENSPEPAPEQISWDILTSLERDLKSLEEAQEILKTADYASKRSDNLYKTFFAAREKILNELYDEIKERFVEIYRELHATDEADFDAELSSKRTGVNLLVDFYGRGMHPPHAVHSEGHQDSMGICLYLALSEKITHGHIDLIILDDVMATVDAPHRREISHLLANSFKNRQFMITTHDQIWAEQLNKQGVVTRRNMYKLSNWTITEGPRLNRLTDSWEQIRNLLSDDEIPAAAAKLRRFSEQYFSGVCELLQVKTKHKEDKGHDLGELLPDAISQYKNLLKKAKKSAEQWGNKEAHEELIGISKYSKEIIEQSKVEQWAMNTNVHYNNWANFTREDFEPVVNSFEGLFSLFRCDNCGELIHLSMDGYTPEALRCNCGKINWNLRVE